MTGAPSRHRRAHGRAALLRRAVVVAVALLGASVAPGRVCAAPTPTPTPPVELSPGEARGSGSARIVGGNQVSARRRALAIARRDAVVKAVAARLSAEVITKLGVKLRRLYARHRRYVSSYRVLAEHHSGGSYTVDVAATIAAGRLARDLAALGGGPKAAVGRPKLALWVEATAHADTSLVAHLRQRARLSLSTRGFRVRDVVGASVSAARADAVRAKAGVLLTISARGQAADPVRGLQLAASRVRVDARAYRVGGDGAALASGMAKKVGVGASSAAAERAAAQLALLPALAAVERVLERRWPSGVSGGGRTTVQVRGLKTAAQHLAFCRAVRAALAGVSSCSATRLARGEAWFSLTTTMTPRALGAALARAAYSGFALSVERVESGVVSMRVSAAASASGGSSG